MAQQPHSPTMDNKNKNPPTKNGGDCETLDRTTSETSGTFHVSSILTQGALLTPPPTRRHTPTMVARPLFSSAELHKPFQNKLPPWVILLLQIIITMPMYIFSFWLMIEGLKAGGQNLVLWIDYIAFRQPPG